MTWPPDDWWQPELLRVSDGTRLAVRRREGATGRSSRPVVLVHGLASNALLWADVAEGLASGGHPVAVVDLRGHGRSDRPASGYSTQQAAADLHDVVKAMGWEEAGPVVAGQSWGGNVAVRAVARQRYWSGLLCVDGGWIDLSDRFASFEECWGALAPPGFGDATPEQVVTMLGVHLEGWPDNALRAVAGNLEPVDDRVRNRLALERHRSIVHSLFSDSPRADHAVVTVPAHLMVAGRLSSPDADRASQTLGNATISWHPDAHHDIHLQHPGLVLDQLTSLLERVEGSHRT
jgi:pimeloyl-ACP methyl ester carboxylesterase